MLKYSVTIQYDSRDNIFVAKIPELSGCMAHGDTYAQAMEEIQIAMELWLECAKEVGKEIPEPMLYVS